MPGLLIPAALLVLVLMVAPMLLLARYSLNLYSPTELMIEAVTPANYAAAVTDPLLPRRSGHDPAGRGALHADLARRRLPAADSLARMRGRWKSMLVLLTVFPLLVGNVVRAVGWMTLLGNTGGVNAGLRGLGPTSGPMQLIYTPSIVVAGFVKVVLPYMILTVASIIERIPVRSRRRRATSAPARSRCSAA